MTPPLGKRRRAAASALADSSGTHCTHVFGGSFPYHAVAEMARDALDAGEAVIFLLHKARLAPMRRHMAGASRVSYLDTHAALAAMTRDGGLAAQEFEAVLGPQVAAAARKGNGRVAIYTDAAGTLVQQERHGDSRVLEGLCHGVCRASPVFLMCIYPIEAYAGLRGQARRDFRVEHHLGHPA